MKTNSTDIHSNRNLSDQLNHHTESSPSSDETSDEIYRSKKKQLLMMFLSITVIGWIILFIGDLDWMEKKQILNTGDAARFTYPITSLMFLTGGLIVPLLCLIYFVFKNHKLHQHSPVHNKYRPYSGLVTFVLFFIPIIGWWIVQWRWYKAMIYL